MSRLHIHISVNALEQSIKFYSALFGVQPSKKKSDYAQWILDDPCMNFAISARGIDSKIDHLGIQAENEAELAVLKERIQKANFITFDDGQTTCCYATSDKIWVKDPNGIAWETYHTMEEAEFFYNAPSTNASSTNDSCCVQRNGSEDHFDQAKPSCCG